MKYIVSCMIDYSHSGMIEDQEAFASPEEYFSDPRYYGAGGDEVKRTSKEAIYFVDGSRYHRRLGWKHPRKSSCLRRKLRRNKKR